MVKLRKSSFIKVISIFFVVVFLFCASSFNVTAPTGSAASLSDLQSKYDALEKELAALKKQQANAQNTIKDKEKALGRSQHPLMMKFLSTHTLMDNQSLTNEN